MVCITENAEINGIESSTEIKQNKDSNLLLVHHDIQQNIDLSLLSEVLCPCYDFFYKQTAQLGISYYEPGDHESD